jgi:hypothetical protein
MSEDRPCRGRTKAGKPCKSPFVNADGFCPAHGPDGAQRMRARGRRGAQTTKLRYSGAGLPRDRLGTLETIQDAQRWLRLIAEAVGARELSHSEGSAMTTAVRAWISSEDTRLRAEDLQELREQLAEIRRKGMRAG